MSKVQKIVCYTSFSCNIMEEFIQSVQILQAVTGNHLCPSLFGTSVRRVLLLGVCLERRRTVLGIFWLSFFCALGGRGRG